MRPLRFKSIHCNLTLDSVAGRESTSWGYGQTQVARVAREEPLTSEDSPQLAARGWAGRAPTHQERRVARDSDPINQGLLLQQTEGAPRRRVQPQRLFEDLQTPHGQIMRDRCQETPRKVLEACPRPFSASIQGAACVPTARLGPEPLQG